MHVVWVSSFLFIDIHGREKLMNGQDFIVFPHFPNFIVFPHWRISKVFHCKTKIKLIFLQLYTIILSQDYSWLRNIRRTFPIKVYGGLKVHHIFDISIKVKIIRRLKYCQDVHMFYIPLAITKNPFDFALCIKNARRNI